MIEQEQFVECCASSRMLEEEHYRLSSSAAAQMAIEEGKIVDFPDGDTLQVDLDDDASEKRMNEAMSLLQIKCRQSWDPSSPDGGSSPDPDPVVVVTASRSGHKHARIKLPFKVSALERIALQAALGSDYKREILSVFDLRRGDPTPTVFFELPGYDNTQKALPPAVEPTLLEAGPATAYGVPELNADWLDLLVQ